MSLTPYYDQRGITIFCGDCLEVMPQLEPGVDAIITDLPYGTTACSWDTVIPFAPMWERVKRLLKPTGAFVTTASQPFTSLLVCSNLEWFKYCLTWEKPVVSGFLDANRRPLNDVEDIVIFGNGQGVYNPQMKIGEAHLNGTRERKNFPSVYGKFSATTTTTTTTYYPRRIIKIPNPREAGQHPTQKPVALYQYLIRTYTNPHELVLDITMGSGTTLVAAQNEGRRAIGIELSEEYCAIAVDCLRQPSFFSLPVEPKANGHAGKQEALL